MNTNSWLRTGLPAALGVLLLGGCLSDAVPPPDNGFLGRTDGTTTDTGGTGGTGGGTENNASVQDLKPGMQRGLAVLLYMNRLGKAMQEMQGAIESQIEANGPVAAGSGPVILNCAESGTYSVYEWAPPAGITELNGSSVVEYEAAACKTSVGGPAVTVSRSTREGTVADGLGLKGAPVIQLDTVPSWRLEGDMYVVNDVFEGRDRMLVDVGSSARPAAYFRRNGGNEETDFFAHSLSSGAGITPPDGTEKMTFGLYWHEDTAEAASFPPSLTPEQIAEFNRISIRFDGTPLELTCSGAVAGCSMLAGAGSLTLLDRDYPQMLGEVDARIVWEQDADPAYLLLRVDDDYDSATGFTADRIGRIAVSEVLSDLD